jgi:ABC-2 type transport system permease protein
MRRNLRFIFLLLKLKLTHMMVFRLSFFGGFLADSMLFLIQILAFNTIYGHIDTIGDWSKGQMMIFIGTFSMLNGINMLVYFFGVLGIPEKIASGELDHYITKPVSPLLRLSFENFDPGSAPLLLLSGVIIAYGVSLEGITLTFPLVLGYSLLVLLMAVLYYDMELILRTIPFFTVAANAITELEGPLLELNFKIPGVLYKGAFKILFYFILPYGVMATVPTQFITGTLSLPGLLQALGVVTVFTVLALRFWRFGLKHYKSASS